MMSFMGLRHVEVWRSGSELRESRVPAGFRSARSINSQLVILSWIFFGVAGRLSPIHTFFLFGAKPDFGSSRLSHVVADCDAIVLASVEDTAIMSDTLSLLAESGNFAVGGIAPNLMGTWKHQGGEWKEKGGESERYEY